MENLSKNLMEEKDIINNKECYDILLYCENKKKITLENLKDISEKNLQLVKEELKKGKDSTLIFKYLEDNNYSSSSADIMHLVLENISNKLSSLMQLNKEMQDEIFNSFYNLEMNIENAIEYYNQIMLLPFEIKELKHIIHYYFMKKPFVTLNDVNKAIVYSSSFTKKDYSIMETDEISFTEKLIIGKITYDPEFKLFCDKKMSIEELIEYYIKNLNSNETILSSFNRTIVDILKDKMPEYTKKTINKYLGKLKENNKNIKERECDLEDVTEFISIIKYIFVPFKSIGYEGVSVVHLPDLMLNKCTGKEKEMFYKKKDIYQSSLIASMGLENDFDKKGRYNEYKNIIFENLKGSIFLAFENVHLDEKILIALETIISKCNSNNTNTKNSELSYDSDNHKIYISLINSNLYNEKLLSIINLLILGIYKAETMDNIKVS